MTRRSVSLGDDGIVMVETTLERIKAIDGTVTTASVTTDTIDTVLNHVQRGFKATRRDPILDNTIQALINVAHLSDISDDLLHNAIEAELLTLLRSAELLATASVRRFLPADLLLTLIPKGSRS